MSHIVVLNCAQRLTCLCKKNSTNSENYVCNVKKKMIEIAVIKKSLLLIIARRICDAPLAILVKLVYLLCVMSLLPWVTGHNHTKHINHIRKGQRFIFSTASRLALGSILPPVQWVLLRCGGASTH